MQYSKIKYPDGQISVRITDTSLPHIIRERINSYEDLMYVVSIAEAMQQNGFYDLHLEIPCLFGQRSDRRFQDRDSFDLKVIANIINLANFKSVEIFDPHSYVSIALINNCVVDSPDKYVKWAIHSLDKLEDSLVLVSPDAGAYKKVYEYGERFGLSVVAAVKHRDLQGKIDLQLSNADLSGKNCLIVDDLLDGGYTFVLLAKKLRECGAKTVNLYISHAYFSKGVEAVEGIDRFFCTNSVKDIKHELVTQYKIV